MELDMEVALAAIALAGTTVGGLIWVVKYLADTLSKDLQEHTMAAIEQKLAAKEQAKASTKSALASEQMLEFMVNLNGELKRAAEKKLQ